MLKRLLVVIMITLNLFSLLSTSVFAQDDEFGLPDAPWAEEWQGWGGSNWWGGGWWWGEDTSNAPCKKDEIRLNTSIPFIGQCIKKTANPNPNEATSGNAFSLLLGGLIRIAMTVVVIIWFMALLVAWVMIASGGVKSDRLSTGKWLIGKVLIWLLLLGASGIILNLINPNFFKTESGGLIIWTTQLF